ncbi:hypothetical protein Y032_0177g617 [Ancylostoma ceylanicum]|uniref:Uncharacterized protein n=1 Tax=Ancylostoma ceylanicum TaxID=53326 RepID=A0A016SUC6_9BILA|nr:hypothetical protein Y032_0177g617 [Ancylostoma ceylanicum]
MAKLSFIVLVITSLLPGLCEGELSTRVKPFCGGGSLDKKTIDNDILIPINARREKLAKGEQNNGNSGQNLPPATNMTKLAPLTEIFTSEVSRSLCGWLPDNHNRNLDTEKTCLPAQMLPWTRTRAWPFWCPPHQLTLLTWYATRVLAQCTV